MKNVSYKNKIHVRLIEFSPFRKRIRIAGLTLYDLKKAQVNENLEKTTRVDTTNIKKKIPEWIQLYIPQVFSMLNELHIIADQVYLPSEDVYIDTIGTVFNYKKSKSEFSYDIFVRRVENKDVTLLSDSMFCVTGILHPGMIGLEMPCESVKIDLKFGIATVPMEFIKRFKSNVPEEKLKQSDIDYICELAIKDAVKSIQSKLNMSREFLIPIFEFNLYMDKILVTDLEFSSLPQLETVSDFLSYHICASNITFNAIRFKEDYPGFKLSYKEDDTPFKINCNFSRANIALKINRKDSEGLLIKKFVEIPNMSIYGHTNMFSQSFKYCSHSTLPNALSTLNFQISSLLVDIDIKTLSFVKSFLANVNVFEGAFSDPEKLMKCNNIEKVRVKKIIKAYFVSLFPLINVKFTLEDSKVVITDEQDTIIYRLSVLLLNCKSKRYIANKSDEKILNEVHYTTDVNLELSDLKAQHIKNDNSNYKHDILYVETIILKHGTKVSPELEYSLEGGIYHIDFDLSELPTMVALNNLQKKLDCQILEVEQEYFKGLYEEFASQLTSTELQCSLIGENIEHKNISPEDILFQQLPEFFDYIKIDLRDIAITLGARSVFMPPHMFSSIAPQSPKDLVDGKLRKFCNTVDKLQIALFGNKTQWHNKVETGHSYMVKSEDSPAYRSYDTHDFDDISTSDSTEVEHLWNLNILLSSLKSTVIYETCDVSDEFSSRTVSKLAVLSIKIFPDIECYSPDSQKKLMVLVDNKKINSVTGLMNVFLACSGFHTIKQIFNKDVCAYRHDSWAKKFFLSVNKTKEKSVWHYIEWKKLKSLTEINCSFENINQILILPNALKIRLDSLNTFINIKDSNDVTITGTSARICIESPTIQNTWVRLLSITNFTINTNVQRLSDQADKGFNFYDDLDAAVKLENESWHFSIPHKFEMYKIFYNISTVIKSLKQMTHSLKMSNNDSVISPKTVKATSLPKINFKSQRGILSIDDDPLEAELNMILQIGIEEQRSRLAKIAEFQGRVAPKPKTLKRTSTLYSVVTEPLYDICSSVSFFKSKFGRCKSKKMMKEMMKKDNKYVSEKELEEIVESEFISQDQINAYERLQENLSTSWIRRVNDYKKSEREDFERNFSFLWGNLDYSRLPEDINKKVQAFVSNPFLSTLILEGIDINVFKPSCGMQCIPTFINDVGKGVPMNTEYSILVPMYIDAKFKEYRLHLRDYPLPLIYVPPVSQSIQEECALHIYGDFIISEDMIKSKNEIRTIFVPLVPSVILENRDEYYSLLVPRTLTSVKIFSNLQFDIKSTQTTQVAWGSSYMPAIQQTMQCLENFSKPPTDQSPKTGFWDKIRYSFHSRLNLSWVNGGRFEISLLGAKNPYMIGGKNAGFILGFNGDILLKVNSDNDSTKFISCTANEIHFSIPNYFAKPLLVWSRPSEKSVFVPNQDDINLQRYASYYYLSQLESKTNEASDIRVMAQSYIEKTGIKLSGGMTLNVGLVFERLLENSKRTFDFISHHIVRLCNPIYVEDFSHFDSYEGFRSHFIHMSFTLLSNSDCAYNAMQLNPSGIQTFLRWWKTFSGNIPVRRGPLYAAQNLSPKFGDALHTISYHADVCPLFITHMPRNIDTTRIPKKSYYENIEFAGIKAKVSHFIMDLHQRKEVMYEYKEALNVNKKVSLMKFLEGFISTDEIDIRTVHGKFKKSTFVEELSNAKFDIFDDDRTWYDLADFKEGFSISIESYIPDIVVKPLLLAPQFIYEKKANYGDKFQIDPHTSKLIDPFNNKVSHSCVIGKKRTVPTAALHRRLIALQQSEVKIKKRIDNFKQGEPSKNDIELLTFTKNAIKNVKLLLEDYITLEREQGKLKDTKYHFPVADEDSYTNSKTYENQYFVIGMLLKWNEGTRDVLLKYAFFLSVNRYFCLLPMHKSLKVFDDIVKQKLSGSVSSDHFEGYRTTSLPNSSDSSHNLFESDLSSPEAIQNAFDMFLKELQTNIGYTANEEHFINFISPQIQLMTVHDPDACIILTAPLIKLRVLSFNGNLHLDSYNIDPFLKRYGVLVTKANVFLFHKDKYNKSLELFFDINSYGQKKLAAWPPWVALDLFYDASAIKSAVIIEDISTILYYDTVSQFSSAYDLVKDQLQNKIQGYLPSIVVSSDSRSYLSLYRISTNLFMSMELDNPELKKKINRLTISYDFNNLGKIYDAAANISQNIKVMDIVESELLFKQSLLDDAGQVDLFNIHTERISNLSRLYIFMSVLCSKRKQQEAATRTMVWDIKLKDIAIHMLNDDSSPFLDVAASNINFERVASSSGFNSNRITIHVAQILSLEQKAVYRNLLGPYISKKDLAKKKEVANEPLIHIQWVMDKPIGGIKVLKEVETFVNGLSISIEEGTMIKLMHWLLPHEIASVLHDSGNNNDGDDNYNSSMDLESLDSEISFGEENNTEVNEMLQRSTDFVIMENITLNGFKLCISFKGKGTKRLINVTDFVFNFPTLRFRNQTMRSIDIIIVLKKVLLKALLRQSGRFFVSKLKSRPSLDTNIKDISHLSHLHILWEKPQPVNASGGV